MPTEETDQIKSLIKKYTAKIEDKKRLNQKLNNDQVEGIILALEDVVEETYSSVVKKNLWPTY
jgi:hypothetical protein